MVSNSLISNQWKDLSIFYRNQIVLGSEDEGENKWRAKSDRRVSFWDYWVEQEDAEGMDYGLGGKAPNGVKDAAPSFRLILMG